MWCLFHGKDSNLGTMTMVMKFLKKTCNQIKVGYKKCLGMFASYHDKKSFPLGLNILGTTICNHQTASRWIVDTDFWNSWSPDKSGKYMYSLNKWINLIFHVKLQKVKLKNRLHEVTIKKNSHQRGHLRSSLLMLKQWM